MNERHWEWLCGKVKGENPPGSFPAFIIDSPWIPGWFGVQAIDYFTSDRIWFEANRMVHDSFPEIIFLPGFWPEYGMCTEPSAYGAKLTWSDSSLPHAEKITADPHVLANLPDPDVRSDGLLPFVIKRLQHCRKEIGQSGHEIRFAVARGPLNIASFLAGTNDFLLWLAMYPEEMEAAMERITRFVCRWIEYQKECFPSVDGIMILDDLMGFVGEDDFKRFALPSLKRIFNTFPATLRFFHNDAHGLVCAPFLEEAGVNLFNFSHEHNMTEMLEKTGDGVILMGNLPPRDVLAAGSPAEVEHKTREMLCRTDNDRRVVWSCGGGMPPDVSSENIKAFLAGLK